MRTNDEEVEKLGRDMAQRLTPPGDRCACWFHSKASASTPSVARTILRATIAVHGGVRRTTGFSRRLSKASSRLHVEELLLHINDVGFADTCVDAFVEIAKA